VEFDYAAHPAILRVNHLAFSALLLTRLGFSTPLPSSSGLSTAHHPHLTGGGVSVPLLEVSPCALRRRDTRWEKEVSSGSNEPDIHSPTHPGRGADTICGIYIFQKKKRDSRDSRESNQHG